MSRSIAAMALLALAGWVPALQGQGYSLRLDSRVQRVDFRGITEDSIPEAETVAGPTGGPVTPAGVAVSCDPAGICRFFLAGPVLHAAPLSQSAALTAWGFGITGLSVHADGRLLTDLSSSDAWPGTEPALQLLQGYIEYSNTALTATLGRQAMFTRLGPTNFDGARVTLRAGSTGLEAEAWAGWGLARATALPITSPALNPLDEFRPSQRSTVFGVATGYSGREAHARLDYQRELDGRSDYLVSERAAFSGDARVTRHLTLSGGGEYDMAQGFWGSADVQARYVTPIVTATVQARHYRPHFDLWTIWGAFSPVPFNSVSAAAWIRPHRSIEVHARGERYWFEPAEASTPLVTVEDDGWRASIGASADLAAAWRVELEAHREFGPGAASRGIDAALVYRPHDRLELRASGAALQRPLEFRYDDASVSTFGLDADWELSGRVRTGAGIARYWETRDRPDAAAFDWSQTRLNARLTLVFGGARPVPLPPGRPRQPSRSVPP
ncbi:MAG TPA: hypothetical protein VFL88_12675 [Gemmatimonadales bacterium]|nr:hypothetical protein [Gemmatimonadales bacterium]